MMNMYATKFVQARRLAGLSTIELLAVAEQLEQKKARGSLGPAATQALNRARRVLSAEARYRGLVL